MTNPPTIESDKLERVFATSHDATILLDAAEVLRRRGRDELAEACGDIALQILREERTYS